MAIKQFVIECKVKNPRSGEVTIEKIGPIYGIKAANNAILLSIKKRNTVGVELIEVNNKKAKE